MKGNQAQLLYNALCYEAGHPRRTQHILKVYALARLLGQRAGLDPDQQEILEAGAILHDIAIKYCKEHGGDACQENQRRAAPELVKQFLAEAGYPETAEPGVLELVLYHHEYGQTRGPLLQLLIEADLIVNCYECPPDQSQRQAIREVFQTAEGKELLTLCLDQEGANHEPA